MFKKTKWILLVVFLLSIPTNAFAQVISQTGSVFLNTIAYDSANDYYKVDLDPILLVGGSVRHRMYETSDFTNATWDSTHYFPGTMDYAYATYTCKKYVQDIFYDANGNQIGEVKFYADQLVNSACKTTYSPPVSDTPATGSTCLTCDLFNCPGWSEHMQGLQDIKNAIPPAPNWQEVANIFNNTITPQIKSDLQQILGQVDEPPPSPIPPSTPDLGDDLNDGGITPPTGDNAPGLDDSGFTENDIKDQAPVIDERPDDSGGFIINNPIDGLPSQDEFKDNVPNEGDVPIPGDPVEQENISPIPEDNGDTITIPIPEDSGGSVDTAPLPDENGTAPLPANDGSTAPLPDG